MNATTATVSLLIDCTPDDAFDAFADPAKITLFWLESTSGPLSKGATAKWNFKVPGATDTVTVEEFERPGRLVVAWSDGSKVRFDFTEHAANRTRVSAGFTVSASDPVEQVVGTTEGYTLVLCDLKTLLESGRSANLVRAKAELITAGRDTTP